MDVQAKQDAALSDDLHVITAEINAYKRVAGEAVFEIGRRLKGVRDNPAIYGLQGYRDWEMWCEREVNITRRQANKYIRVFEHFHDKTVAGKSTSQLSLDALNLLVDFQDDERERPHVIPSTGEIKTVDEMTVRELREVKAELKREREARQRAEESASYTKTSRRNPSPRTSRKRNSNATTSRKASGRVSRSIAQRPRDCLRRQNCE